MATDSTQSGTAGLPERVVEDLLDAARRRQLLVCLADNEGEMVLADLAAAVSAREADTDPASVDRETYQSVRTDIYERHLPKLTATGVVTYDSMRGTVTLRAPAIAAAARR